MKRITTLLTCLAALLMMPSFGMAASKEISISGSTTVLPIIQSAGEAFMAANPDIALAISGGGSGSGIKALNEGLCDVAMASRDVKESEITLGQKRGVELVKTVVAIDALVPVVHPDNPVKALSSEQLRDIYAGKIKNWSEVGGNDEKIMVVSRDTSSGTYETWMEIIMQGQKVMPAALLQASNGTVVQNIAKNKRAIGYVGFGYLNDSLKGLAVDGVNASAETALNKTWPIARELYLFTNGQPEGGIGKFMNFLVDAQKGQKYVAKVGYIPLQK